MESLKNTLVEKDKQIKCLEVKLAEVDQRTQDDSLEFAGLIPKNDEQTFDAIKRIASIAGVEIKEEDIVEVKRIPDKRPGVPPKFHVKLNNRQKRYQLLANRKLLNSATSQDPGSQRIYISEILSPHYKDLLWRTKSKAKETGFNYVWYKDSKIMIRKKEGEKIIYIKHADDLIKMV